jgi:aminoglycoside phosphotransferase (APT) family kinase protein
MAPRAALDARLGPDLARLVTGLGSPVVGVDEVTALPSPVLPRRTFRIRLADGRVVKGRRLDDAHEAARLALLRDGLPDDRFSALIVAGGSATIEEWVPGPPVGVDEAADPALLSWCGETLGVVHAAPAPRRAPGAWPLTARQTASELSGHLAVLVETGLLGRAHARRLRAIAAAHRPERVRIGIVHRDLAPGNVVRADAGGWRVVDNASLDLGPPALDLARTRHAWPMTGDAWRTFLDGYATRADPRGYTDHAPFWDAVVIAEVVTFRRAARTGGISAPLATLRALASTRMVPMSHPTADGGRPEAVPVPAGATPS